MKKPIRQISSILILIIVGVGLLSLVFKQISPVEVFNVFRSATWMSITTFALVSIVILTLHSYRWKIIISTTGKNVSLFQIMQYKIVGSGISFLTPGAKIGGEPLRAALLKKHGLKFNTALSTVVTDKIVDLSVQGFMFTIGIIVAVTSFAMPRDISFLLILSAIISFVMIVYVYYQLMNDKNLFLKLFKMLKLHRIKKLAGFEHKIVEFEKEVVKFHKQHKKEFYLTVLITGMSWVLMFVEYQSVSFMVLGHGLSPVALFMIITMMGAAYMSPIPLALGIFEAGQIAIFKTLNLNSASAVGLALLIRGRDLFWSLLAFPILMLNGISIMKFFCCSTKKEEKNKEN